LAKDLATVLFPAPEGPSMAMVNLSTLRPEGRGFLKINPERFFFTPFSTVGLGAAEGVNLFLLDVFTIPTLNPLFSNGVYHIRKDFSRKEEKRGFV
jgi:hypothetical protein